MIETIRQTPQQHTSEANRNVANTRIKGGKHPTIPTRRRRIDPLNTNTQRNIYNLNASSKGAGQRERNTRKEQTITLNVNPKLKNQSSKNPTTTSYIITQMRWIRMSTIDTRQRHRRMAHLLPTHTGPKAQNNMVPFSGKQIWKIDKCSRRMHQRNKHHSLHQERPSPCREKERRNVREL
jgi:hypothetical protein